MYLNITNAIYDKPIAYIIPKSERLKTSSEVRNKTRMTTFSPILFNIVLEILAKVIR